MPDRDDLPGLNTLPAAWQAPIRRALSRVADPELAEPITDLGLVHALALQDGVLCVTLLATSATCPMADLLVDDTADALIVALSSGPAPLAPELSVQVEIDWNVTWHPSRMAPALRERLGWPDPT